MSQPKTKIEFEFRKMPPRKHNCSDPFDIKKSEVIKWLVENPVVLQSLFTHANSEKHIVFDQNTKMWHGADWRAN